MSTKSTLNFEALEANRNIRARNYWRNRLAGFEFNRYFDDNNVLDLSAEEPFREYRLSASRQANESLSAIAKSHKAQHIVLLSTLGILAHKISFYSDIGIFCPLYLADPSLHVKDNIVPVRISNFSGSRFIDLLDTVKENFIQDSSHGNYPLKKILNSEFSDLFSIGIVNEQLQQTRDFEGARFDLLFSFSVTEELALTIKYNASKFSSRYIEQTAALYFHLLQKLLTGSEKDIADIEILPEKEKQRLLHEFNATEVDYPTEETVISLFEEQAKRRGGHVALQWGSKTLSYDELNERSDKIASYLQKEMGVEEGSLVGVMLGCEEYFVPLLLGILKAGAGYVPIDPSYPIERINAIIEDSQLRVLVTRGKYQDESLINTLKVIDLDQAVDTINVQGRRLVRSQVSSSSLAYVIYTSGSTGKPKGVMIEHKSLTNYIRWAAEYYVKHEEAVFALFTSIAFDLTVTSIFTPLITGNKIVLYEEDEHTLLVDKVFSDNEATIVKLTPSHLKIVRDSKSALFSSASKLKVLIVGGEELETGLADSIHNKFWGKVEICNEYGPTEATVGCMIHKFEPGSPLVSVPIGVPVNNTQIYLLDAFLNPVPVGAVGELYISGHGLARGYLNDESLSKKSFITNPFLEEGRMYKTGDLAVRQFDGLVLFKGRTDDQVKLRGFRIELSEIVSHLTAHEQVKEAVVLIKGDGEDKYLVAYYVSEEELEVSGLRKFLEQRLPQYEIPSYYVRLERMPLTANGKLDKKSLPDPEKSTNDYIAPSNEIERKLVEIWSEVLKMDKEKIGVNSNFFELGGNSLKIVLMLNRISKELNVLLPINAVFNHQDIKGLTLYIQERTKSEYAPVKKVASKKYYELSSAQKRLYFVYQYHKESLAYNGVNVTILRGHLNRKRLINAFQQLIARHESLRTSFEIVNHAPVQKIHELVELEIEYFNSKKGQVDSIIDEFVRAFDLAKPPLFRVGLIETYPQEHVLVVDTHHIITDGLSQHILIKDLIALYNGDELPQLRLQYKDYAEWQKSDAQQKNLVKQKDFWVNEFSEDLEILPLPTDFPRPSFKSFKGGSVSFEVSEEVTKALIAIAEKEEATMFMMILSMYNVLLCKLGNQEDIVIGTPVACRQHADLENIVGMFVNTLALRNYPKGSLSFREFLSKVKSKTLSCFENQAYPYEELIENLGVHRDTSRNPLFDVMFVYQDFEKSIFEIPELTLEGYDSVQPVSKFDLTLTVKRRSDKLFMNFEYSTDLFKEETVKGFAAYFEMIINSIVADRDKQISDIKILSQKEKSKLLFEFNDTTIDYPSGETIVSMFERQVTKTPNHIALRYGNDLLTYSELNNKANNIASYLRVVQGIEVGDLVGLMLEREEYLIPCIFGILKAGGAYVPIDPKYPAERINNIVSSSKMKVLITRKRHHDASLRVTAGLVDLDEAMDTINAQTASPADVKLRGTDLAYVIFTSGSTGIPKGVMIEHHSVINRILWMQKEYPITADDLLLQKTPIVFDVSVWEIFWWSFVGASLCLLKPGGEKERNEIIKAIETHKVTTIHFVPSMLNIFLSALEGNFNFKQLSSLRYVFASGEALTPKHVNLFGETIYRNCNTRLINLYGPTEATVDVSFYECEFEKRSTIVPIGKPIDNIKLYVLDKNGRLAPVGVLGELYIAGTGVARGYLNDERLTALKFIKNAFISGERMYRTGDLVRWLPDGNIEFLGRIDSQVKIRGFRIELGEIEYQLCNYGGVREAVVLAKGKEEKYLVAYYVSNEELESVDLRAFLSEKLPGYMIPLYYVRLERIPLTTNGKLDKKALPDPDLSTNMESVDAKPINDTQKELVKIWSEVLDIEQDKISVNKNFFHIGGDSLKLIKMVDKVNQRFNTEMTVANMFKFPMISLLAKFLNKENEISSGVEDGLEQMNEAFKLFNQIRE